MSLISTKNFLAPFSNTVNLVTIIVIALLFGIYRLSGGGVFTAERSVRVPSALQNQQQLLYQRQEAQIPDQRVPVQKQASKDPFTDLLKPSAPKKVFENPGSDDLNDIEKQLGLR